MPYTKSIVAGVIIFILLIPIIGTFPYKGADNYTSFDLTIPKAPAPLTKAFDLQTTAGATYETTIKYEVVAYSDGLATRGGDFNGFGGANGTIKNLGAAPAYIGITSKDEFDKRLSAYGNETFAGNMEPLTALMGVSKYAYVVPGETQDVELAFSGNVSDVVFRIIPSPFNPGDVSITADLNFRNYITLSRFLTKIVFMADTDFKNFSISITTKTLGTFYIYIGITSATKFDERSRLYGSVQYRQMDKAKDALTTLGMQYSSRSRIMTRAIYGSLPVLVKGYYVVRAVSYYSNNIDLAVSMSSTRPSVGFFTRFRLAIVLIIALYRPLRIRREIEFMVR